MGQDGREWVSKNFSQERQIRETQEIYLRALEQHESQGVGNLCAIERADAFPVMGGKTNR
jgi:hypothetical protein